MAMFRMCQCQDGGKVLIFVNEDVRALKDAFGKPKHTKEHIKKDSIPKILSLSQNSSSNEVFI